MSALSDYFYKGPKITLHTGREINIQRIQQSLTYAHVLEGMPYGQYYDGTVGQHLEWARQSYPDRKILVLEPRLRPLPIPEVELNQIKSLGTPPEIPVNKVLTEDELDLLSLERVIALSHKAREPVSIGSVSCRAYFQSGPLVDGMLSELLVIWFQDGFAMPIDPYVIDQIKSIDWDKEAEIFDL